jgi:hypothetical protein
MNDTVRQRPTIARFSLRDLTPFFLPLISLLPTPILVLKSWKIQGHALCGTERKGTRKETSASLREGKSFKIRK